MKQIICLLSGALMAASAIAQSGLNWDFSGYTQANPVFINANFPAPLGEVNWWEYRLQSRLNIRWTPVDNFQFHAQMRLRFFAGDLVSEIPHYAAGIDTDDGLVKLSFLIADRKSWLMHFQADRLYAQWNKNNWDIRVGRQRVNWGISMITNPNDLFNIYSFYDFDYRERPGSDAVRIQRHFGFSQRLELAISPASNFRKSVAALLYAFHWEDYDFQLISGYYRNRVALGGGWAGNLKTAGFKGELMYFRDLEENGGSKSSNFVGLLAFDYMFTSGLFVVSEFLFNEKGGREAILLLAESLSPDNPSFSKYQKTVQLSYPINPLLDALFATIWYPDDRSFFLSPGLNWSVIENLDIQLVGQFFAGGKNSTFGNAANLVTASVRYSY